MIPRRRFLALCGGAALAPCTTLAQPRIDVMRFSALRAGSTLPAYLRPHVFENQPRHTDYALVEDGGRTVLRARAVASTSGLVRELRVDPVAYPLLSWRWKVTQLLAQSDLASKAGDDFPARLYVTFDLDTALLSAGERMMIGLARMLHGPAVPVAALCYVWDSRAPVGTIAANAYTDRVRMVVVDSGAANLGRWVAHERDVAADFRGAFALPAPQVTGVIVSTDTDNTGETAETYYGDVSFRPRP